MQNGEDEASRKAKAFIQKTLNIMGVLYRSLNVSTKQLVVMCCGFFGLVFFEWPSFNEKKKITFFRIGNVIFGVSHSMMRLFCRIRDPAHNT